MNDLEFREQLPESCPPSEAVPTDDITVYRFSFTKDGYISDDFTSHWNRYPARRKSFLESGKECMAHGISVYKSEESLRNALRMPALKKTKEKVKCIMEIPLIATDGLIMQTSHDGHYTWWVSSTFAPDKASIRIIQI